MAAMAARAWRVEKALRRRRGRPLPLSFGAALIQQRGMKMVLAYVTNVLVKMNMFRTRCMLFSFAKTIEFVNLGNTFPFCFSPFFEDFSAAQPFLLQQVNNQLVHDFLSQHNNRFFLFLSELMDLFMAGRDQSAADQPNYLAEGHPPL